MAKALFALALLAIAATGEEIRDKQPGRKSSGQVYQWKARDGLVYRYYVPKTYDPEKGANLTLILHGSNLSAGWGFWNHKAGQFRPDDVVVSPNGTTPNGRGGFNFLGEKRDAKRLHALHAELRTIFKVNATFLYGHSQGSFFAFMYAGLYPGEVQGVVGHASGVWTWTQAPRKAHHQAIVLMHGTQDPVVPYGQSVGGYEWFKERKYPIVRLRSLEGWNHWPAEHNGPIRHTSQQLAWVEGMTTSDAQRLEVSFEFLANCKKKERTDYAAVYSLAKRIRSLPFAPAGVRKRAGRAVAAIEKLAEAHARSIRPNREGTFEPKSWVFHLPLFLRSFMGVPAREELARQWAETLKKHEQAALGSLKKYWPALRRGKHADAFKHACDALAQGFLYHGCSQNELLAKLQTWRGEAKKLKIPKKAIKQYDALVPAFVKAIKEGYRSFDAINRKVGKY